MEINIYYWNNLPQAYKRLAPYTEKFFEYSSVQIVLVAKNYDHGLNYILDQFKQRPTDIIRTSLEDKSVMICFWASDLVNQRRNSF